MGIEPPYRVAEVSGTAVQDDDDRERTRSRRLVELPRQFDPLAMVIDRHHNLFGGGTEAPAAQQ
jgi:hypothetical protein